MLGSWVMSPHQTAWTADTVLTLAKTQKGRAAALCRAVSADQEPAQTRAESQPWLDRAPILAWSPKEPLRQTISADLSLRKSPLNQSPTGAIQGKVMLRYLPSGCPRCRWVCLFIWTDLEKCSITSLAHQWILCSEWVPSEWESKQLIKTSQ